MSTINPPFTRREALSRFEAMAADHKKAIGRRIAKLREAKRWTQPRLAAEIPAQEVDAQQISKWERGIHTPRKHLEALAEALDVDEGVILAGDYGRDERGPAPDPFGTPAPSARLTQIESALADLQEQVAWLVAQQKAAAARDSAQAPGPSTQRPPARRRTRPGN